MVMWLFVWLVVGWLEEDEGRENWLNESCREIVPLEPGRAGGAGNEGRRSVGERKPPLPGVSVGVDNFCRRS